MECDSNSTIHQIEQQLASNQSSDTGPTEKTTENEIKINNPQTETNIADQPATSPTKRTIKRRKKLMEECWEKRSFFLQQAYGSILSSRRSNNHRFRNYKLKLNFFSLSTSKHG